MPDEPISAPAEIDADRTPVIAEHYARIDAAYALVSEPVPLEGPAGDTGDPP